MRLAFGKVVLAMCTKPWKMFCTSTKTNHDYDHQFTQSFISTIITSPRQERERERRERVLFFNQ
jgi:hypothetical protein